jgi:hypothetical protein
MVLFTSRPNHEEVPVMTAPQPQGPSLEELSDAVKEARQQLLDDVEYLPKDSDVLNNNFATLNLIRVEERDDPWEALYRGRVQIIDDLEYLPNDSAARNRAVERLKLIEAVIKKHRE